MYIREISKRRFDSLCYSKLPPIRHLASEVLWYEALDGKLICTVFKDRTDADYGFAILGRDGQKLFRAIKISDVFEPSPALIYPRLLEAIQNFVDDGQEVYPQGDEIELPNEIFETQLAEDKVHHYFRFLRDERRFEAARNLIKEIAYSFFDVDGHFIKEFQGPGFDTRLWELFLHTYFYHAGFERDDSQSAPDFCLNKLGYKVAVEAVTVGSNEDFDQDSPMDGVATVEINRDYIPIKYGSALWSKVTRKKPYWEMEHVKGKPFILAVHDYHRPANLENLGSMTWSRAGLSAYLYGQRDVVEIKDGKIVGPKLVDGPGGPEPLIEKVDQHTFGGKSIPSNFFELPEAKYVSAVLFSNGATITTFNRMGKLAGLGSHDIKMIRCGLRVMDDVMQPFAEDVDDPDYEESWGDTIIMYHNPNAIHPVDPNAFPDISHVIPHPESGECLQYINPGHVFSSCTFTIQPSS